MTFILGIDEMLLSAFGSAGVKYIMNQLQGYEDASIRLPQDLTDETVLNDLHKARVEEDKHPTWKFVTSWFLAFPKRLLVAVIITVLAICRYYHANCVWVEDNY